MNSSNIVMNRIKKVLDPLKKANEMQLHNGMIILFGTVKFQHGKSSFINLRLLFLMRLAAASICTQQIVRPCIPLIFA